MNGKTFAGGMSLRYRLNLLIALVMAIMVAIGSATAIAHARRSVEEEIRSTVNLALQVIKAGIGQPSEGGRLPPDYLARLVPPEHTRHLRITVSGSTTGSISLAGAGSKDILAVPGWFVWATAPPPFISEQRVPDGRGGELLIRIEADSADEIAEAYQETRGFLYLFFMLAVLVYGLVHFTVGQAFRSIEDILVGLEGIEKGNYDRRLPAFSLPEFSRIAGAFNHMAAVLQESKAQNQALTRRSLRLQEDERRYLAQELHDQLGQSLTAIKVMATTLRLGNSQNQEAAGHIIDQCDQSFKVFRGMLRRLRPGMLDELGLAAALEDLVGEWRLAHPELKIELFCEEKVDDAAGQACIHLYRIIQEALTNTVRHANARHVTIHLEMEPFDAGAGIALRIADDGSGLDMQALNPGLGLAGIRERVASLEGHLLISSSPDEGFSLLIHIPVEGTVR